MSTGSIRSSKTPLEIFDFSLEEFARHPESQATKIEQYRVLLKITSEAFDNFFQKKWSAFDGLVGENGCHLRAWKVLELAQAYILDSSYASHMNKIAQKIKTAISQLEMLTKSNDKYVQSYEGIQHACRKITSLRLPPEILDSDEIKDISEQISKKINEINYRALKEIFKDLLMDQDVEFLIYSYLLTICRDWEKNGCDAFGHPASQVSNFHLLKTKYKCGKMMAEKLILVAQRNLAQLSLNYVQEIARRTAQVALYKRLQEPFILWNERKVPRAPCYDEFNALLIHAKQVSISFLVSVAYRDEFETVQKIVWFFQTLDRGPLIPSKQDFKKPVIVLDAISHITEDRLYPEAKVLFAIQKFGLEKMILSFAAQHEPYPKNWAPRALPHLDDKDIKMLKAFAHEQGFSYENPGTFLLKHIYCDILTNYLPWLGRKSPFKTSLKVT
ncbi:MAG: hypothetical protein JSS10_06150 [Verrucomicrobia bacterium]|nr:hypothetical protein [Verrucomicrobiota bacterium]